MTATLLAMKPLTIGLIVLGVAIGIGLIVWAFMAHVKRERERKAALAAWGRENGFTFTENDPYNLDGRYRGVVGDIGSGHDRYALEVLHRSDPTPAFIFQYHYKTWETRTVTDKDGKTRTEMRQETHWRRYLVVELPGAAFPGFWLRPENFFDKVAGFVGFDDIDFESEAFSKKWCVKSDNREFAYALVHPQMMEWLMPQSLVAELKPDMLAMDIGKEKHTAEGCQKAWERAAGLINRIPPFVWQDYGKRPAVTLPETRAYVAPPPLAAAQ